MSSSGGGARNYAAGVLPVSYDEAGTLFFLVGREASRDRGWSDFGGKAETRDCTDVRATALREFSEESLGCVVSQDAMRPYMTHGRCILLPSRTLGGSPYLCFVLLVPFDMAARDGFLRTADFLKNRGLTRYLEKSDIRYVRMDELTALPKRLAFQKTVETHRDTLKLIAKTPAQGWRSLCGAVHTEAEFAASLALVN